ncbi:Guanine nucleotide-binding protein alpha-4 subunit [Mycena sanguinolenta]|uniref:Guanine nucleotide-binding protein alpha-4 subunit n=1 Tax=Mycena sanguinolenta TaxID=230812 RepID=A0A8H7CXC7_9AGAR|nr:Guanine nucleotide-binding protein alpha-4 subunit [Mycena sanguinolenta]
MVARTHKTQLSDPFSLVLQPPPNETPAERQKRVELEQEQKRVSDQIDDELRKERTDKKKRSRREVKVLLLGQSESGKSTVLKNFRLKYAPTQWKAELRSWRAVIQLNLIQNVLTILDLMQDRLALLDSPTSSPIDAPAFTPSPYGRTSMDSTLSEITMAPPGRSNANITLTQKHRVLNLRLSPLREVGDDLRRRLGASDPEFTFANGSDGAMNGVLDDAPTYKCSREFGVRGWIGALGLPLNATKKADEPMPIDEATEILATLRDDIISLWQDPDVRELLKAERVRIEDRPGFFLSDTARITSRTYIPSDNDVVRARLRTLGVQEWRITLEQSSDAYMIAGDAFGSEWVIYDVGGSRSMRHAWLPYFDAVNAIIFLAPISCFDERLAEDPSVNRLEDTLLLWRAIVASPLLKNTTLIVFLNKCDLLKRKLQSGIQVNKHMISFGTRQNEVGTVVKYLKDKFKDIIRADSNGPRTTYLYATSVTDTKATAATLNIVRDGIIREHLKHAEFV